MAFSLRAAIREIVQSLSFRKNPPTQQTLNDGLQSAMKSGDHRAVKDLLNRGANFDLPNASGQTLLHWLAVTPEQYYPREPKRAEEEVMAIARFAIQGGAVLSTEDQAGYTPLRRAIQHGEAYLANGKARLADLYTDAGGTQKDLTRKDWIKLLRMRLSLKTQDGQGSSPDPTVAAKGRLKGFDFHYEMYLPDLLALSQNRHDLVCDEALRSMKMIGLIEKDATKDNATMNRHVSMILRNAWSNMEAKACPPSAPLQRQPAQQAQARRTCG